IIEGQNGLFLNQNPDDDALLLNRIAKNEDDTCNKLRLGAREASSHIPPWQEVVARYLKLYWEVVSHVEI
ncbi:MAG: hypothetical protein MN733_40120, partial [Nitrososphaera sp.]|nr:hypothetical protein [Nitrososphaera sp.]